MSLGERIKEQRKSLDYHKKKWPSCRCKPTSSNKVETGQSALGTENLFKLAEIFGTTVDILLARMKKKRHTGGNRFTIFTKWSKKRYVKNAKK